MSGRTPRLNLVFWHSTGESASDGRGDAGILLRGGQLIKKLGRESNESGTLNDKGEPRPLDVKAGDRILFGKWSGTEVRLNGEELLIMKESDIMGILEGTTGAKRAA